MGVVKMSARFLGLHPTGTLHENARDDLKAVCDPVLDFLNEDCFLPDEVVFLFRFGARVSHVGDGHQATGYGPCCRRPEPAR